MTRMKRIITVLLLVMFMTLQVVPLVYAQQLQVTFIPQVPPGRWEHTLNCGQTSSLMAFCYHNKTTPTEDGIRDIDDWLHGKFGHPIRNYNGSYTDVSILETLAREYGGFPDSHAHNHWSLDQLRAELSTGYPVIVATHIRMDPNTLGHFMLLTGIDDHNVYVNDPGLTHGGNNRYDINQFLRSWSAQSNACVTIHPQPPPPEPAPEEPSKPEKEPPQLRTPKTKNVTYVIVIDDSGSMKRNDPPDQEGESEREKAAKICVDSASKGDKISIISFSGLTFVPVPLTTIEDNQQREEIKSKISLSSAGETNLNNALSEANKEIKKDKSFNKKVVIFLSDGSQDTLSAEEYNNESHLRFQRKNIPIYTILLESQNASSPPPFGRKGWIPDPELLAKIANETGGEFVKAPTPEALKGIFQKFSAQTQDRVNIFSTTESLKPEEKKERIISVTKKATQVLFITSWLGSDVETILITPEGKKIDLSTKNSNIRHIKEKSYQIYEIKNPAPGKWKVQIKAIDVPEEGEKVDINVYAKLDEQKPEVSITKPHPGCSLKSPIKIEVEAKDNIQVEKVEFYYRSGKKWKKIGTDRNGKDGWGITWKTNKNDLVEIKAKAYDQAGNSASAFRYAILDHQKPRISKIKIPRTEIWGFQIPLLTKDKTEISYKITDKYSPMETKVEIKNSKGKIIKQIEYEPEFPQQNILQDSVKLIWNGKDNKDKIAPVGVYQFIISIKDRTGNKKTASTTRFVLTKDALWQWIFKN